MVPVLSDAAWRRRLGAIAVASCGLAMTFTLVMVMNAPSPPPKQEDLREAVEFEVAPKPPPPKPKPKPRPKPRPRRVQAPQAPTPTVGADLSGLSFGLPGLSGDVLDTSASDLLGDTGSLDSVVMTEDAVDEPPRAIERTPPSFPRRARMQGLEGRVVLGLLIDAEGRVEKVKVLEASPEGVFEQSALTAVRRWRFQPASYRGRRVKVWARQVMQFDLG